MNNYLIVSELYNALNRFENDFRETSTEKFDNEVWLDVEELLGHLGQYLDV